MQTQNMIFMNIAKIFLLFVSAIAAFLLSACQGLTNLTPQNIPENTSRTYTLSFSAYINDGSLVPGSIRPYIVIDGETIPMKTVSDLDDKRVFEYDYQMPKGRNHAKYYFVVKYKSDMGKNGVIEKEITSPTVYELNAVSRYVANVQAERGIVGSEVMILGNGFDSLDKVRLGGTMADTRFVSRTTLAFIVPPLDCGKNYDLEIVNNEGSSMWVSSFRVDPSEMEVSPSVFVADSGDVVNMIFKIGFNAPEGGYPIEVTTNVPSSIVMPEVVVPEGESSVAVPVEAAKDAAGMLFINAKGFKEKTVPVEISPADSEASAKSEAPVEAPKKPDVQTAEKK